MIAKTRKYWKPTCAALTVMAGMASLPFANAATHNIVSDRNVNWSQTVTLPEFPPDSRLLARLYIQSTGDPWDRHGIVTVDTPDGRVDLVKFTTRFGGTY